MVHAYQRFIQRSHNARFGQYIGSATGALNRLVTIQYLRIARRDEPELIKAHRLERARCCTDIAVVRRFNQNEAGHRVCRCV